MMGFGFIGFFLVVILLGVVIAIAAGFLGARNKDSRFFPSRKSGAKEILDQRFAKGEISKEEYKKIKKEIAD